MRVNSNTPDFETTLCFLNGKWCKYALEADDEEGWVDVPDIKSMSPLIETAKNEPPVIGEVIEEWEEIKTKRLYGKVEFKKVIQALPVT